MKIDTVKNLRNLALGIFTGALLLYPWAGLFYWVFPVISASLLIYSLNNRGHHITFEDCSIPFILGLIFIISAISAGGFYMATKRSIYFLLLLVNYTLILNFYRTNESYKFLQGIMIIIFVESFILLCQHYLYGEGITSETSNKNVIGGLVFLLTLISSKIFIQSKSNSSLIFFFSSLLMLILSFSAKYLIMSSLILLYLMFRMSRFKVILILGISYFLLILNAEFSLKIQRLSNSMFYKNLAVIDNDISIGRHAVNNRIELIKDGLALYSQGNLIIGEGLEYERFVLGTYSHNSYVSTLIGGGMLGTVVFLLYIYSLLHKSLEAKIIEHKYFNLLLLLCLLVVLMAHRYYDSTSLMLAFSLFYYDTTNCK